MADEKNVAKAKEQAKEPNKFVKFLKDLPANVARPFRNMWHELRKVTWPTKQDLIQYSLIVLAFLAFMGVVIGLLDLGSTALVNLFI